MRSKYIRNPDSSAKYSKIEFLCFNSHGRLNGRVYSSGRFGTPWLWWQMRMEEEKRGWSLRVSVPTRKKHTPPRKHVRCPRHGRMLEYSHTCGAHYYSCPRCEDEQDAFSMVLRHVWSWVVHGQTLPPSLQPRARALKALANRVPSPPDRQRRKSLIDGPAA